ncbi:hypothetical protein F5X96DRAFT_373020 [Biscogniauxia mediterranea]|nr:hypothetical protein F5X96DRAFT_373020 [Biscogniauxia mediterranea]
MFSSSSSLLSRRALLLSSSTSRQLFPTLTSSTSRLHTYTALRDQEVTESWTSTPSESHKVNVRSSKMDFSAPAARACFTSTTAAMKAILAVNAPKAPRTARPATDVVRLVTSAVTALRVVVVPPVLKVVRRSATRLVVVFIPVHSIADILPNLVWQDWPHRSQLP